METRAFFTPVASRSDQARTRLLEAAVRVFGEKGPDGATVRDIAKLAGQNVAAIAYYFGGKDKLYRAVIEGIVREIRHNLGDILDQVAQLRSSAEPGRADAIRLLKSFLSAVYLRLLSRKDAAPVVQIIVREQLGPTPAFEILYQQGFRQLHEALCFLAGIALGRDPRDRETIVRTHMMMGQVYFFAMSREAILRRLGWRSLEGRNTELITKVLEENIDVLLSGLATRSITQ